MKGYGCPMSDLGFKGFRALSFGCNVDVLCSYC